MAVFTTVLVHGKIYKMGQGCTSKDKRVPMQTGIYRQEWTEKDIDGDRTR